MAWKRCSEEMPERWTSVLAWTPELDVSVVAFTDDDDEWSNAWTEGILEFLVTHWQPLPEPPEEGE